jgi:hypothetical protein
MAAATQHHSPVQSCKAATLATHAACAQLQAAAACHTPKAGATQKGHCWRGLLPRPAAPAHTWTPATHQQHQHQQQLHAWHCSGRCPSASPTPHGHQEGPPGPGKGDPRPSWAVHGVLVRAGDMPPSASPPAAARPAGLWWALAAGHIHVHTEAHTHTNRVQARPCCTPMHEQLRGAPAVARCWST